MKDTPNLMARIISLLDTLGTVENKKVLLRVISALGENTQNKLEIGIDTPNLRSIIYQTQGDWKGSAKFCFCSCTMTPTSLARF